MGKGYPPITGIRDVWELPRGYRWLGECVRETEKAALFRYFGLQLWLPKVCTVLVLGKSYAAPAARIERAKEFTLGRAR